MSLVTTARLYFSRSCLQRLSSSAVLPEPTGPPTPIVTLMESTHSNSTTVHCHAARAHGFTSKSRRPGQEHDENRLAPMRQPDTYDAYCRLRFFDSSDLRC